MSTDKKTLIISVIAVAVFIAAISSASYAYYTTSVLSKGDSKVVSGTTAKLSTTFEDNGEIEIKNMIPGDYFTRTFSLENFGNDLSYKIVVDDLVNEFENYEDITYVLTENGKIIEPETEELKAFPHDANANELSTTRTIKNGEKKTYTLTITYNNTEVDQAPDMGKTISGKLFIKAL